MLAQDEAFVRALQSQLPKLEAHPDVELLKKELRSEAVKTILDNPSIIDKDK